MIPESRAQSLVDRFDLCLASGYSSLYESDFNSALTCFFNAVLLEPQSAEAWAALAEVTAEVSGHVPTGVVTGYSRALTLVPDEWRWRIALGEAMLAGGDNAGAVTIFSDAAAMRPGAAEAWRGVARALGCAGDTAGAVDAAWQWRSLAPRDGEAACCLATLLLRHDDPLAAAEVLAPFTASGVGEDAEALTVLAQAWVALGERDKAIKAVERALSASGGECPAAAGLHAALLASPADVGAAPTDAYVRALFDRYAERFDRDLVGRLGYTGPAALHEAVVRVCGSRNGRRVLDLGCGTGLSGEPFREMAAVLHGVDLSPAMVARAAKRGIYDELSVESLQTALTRGNADWDLVIAADVLTYVGGLEEVFASAARSLVAGGAFAFLVEAMVPEEGEGGVVLRASRRFAHGADYLKAGLASSGFDVASCETVPMRHDRGLPIPALCVVAVKR